MPNSPIIFISPIHSLSDVEHCLRGIVNQFSQTISSLNIHDMGSERVVNVADPAKSSDAATKEYVDEQIQTLIGTDSSTGTVVFASKLYFLSGSPRALITSVNGDIELKAGGTNQNIVLTPSGTGYVEVFNKLGIAIAPSTLFHASTNGLVPSSALFGAGDAGIFTGNGSIVRVIGAPVNPGLVFQSAHGTIAVPTTSVNGDTLGTIFWFGYDGTSRQQGAIITALADAAVSAGIVPGRISFQTANTGGALVEALRLDSAQLATFAGDVNLTSGVYRKGGAAGVSGTINLAKLTVGGTLGSITVSGGIITAFTNPT